MNRRFGDVAIQIDQHLMRDTTDAKNCGEALKRQYGESSAKLKEEISTGRCRKKKKETCRSDQEMTIRDLSSLNRKLQERQISRSFSQVTRRSFSHHTHSPQSSLLKKRKKEKIRDGPRLF